MQVSPPPSIPSPPPPPPPLQERKLGHAGWAERKLGQAGWTEVDEHARRARQHILTCCCPGYQVHLERGIERSLEHAAPLPVLRKAQKGEVLSLLSTCLLCPETETQQICSVAHWSVSQGIIVRRCFLVPSGNISCFNFTTSCFVVDMQSYHSLQEVKITHFHILEDFKLKDLLAFSFLDSKKLNSHTISSGTANVLVWQLWHPHPQLSLCSHGAQRLGESCYLRLPVQLSDEAE